MKKDTLMAMTRRSLFLAALTSLVAGCSTNIPKDYKLAETGGMGLATGTITYTGAGGLRRVVFTNKTTGELFKAEAGQANTINPFAKPDVDPDLGTVGEPFAIELPVGEYAITSWMLIQGPSKLSPAKPIDIPFTIEAGKAIYLGNIHFRQTSSRGLGTGGVKVSLEEQGERDITVLKKRFPVFASMPIVTTIEPATKIEALGGYSRLTMDMPIFVPVAPR